MILGQASTDRGAQSAQRVIGTSTPLGELRTTEPEQIELLFQGADTES